MNSREAWERGGRFADALDLARQSKEDLKSA
jgi:hypothetical protein